MSQHKKQLLLSRSGIYQIPTTVSTVQPFSIQSLTTNALNWYRKQQQSGLIYRHQVNYYRGHGGLGYGAQPLYGRLPAQSVFGRNVLTGFQAQGLSGYRPKTPQKNVQIRPSVQYSQLPVVNSQLYRPRTSYLTSSPQERINTYYRSKTYGTNRPTSSHLVKRLNTPYGQGPNTSIYSKLQRGNRQYRPRVWGQLSTAFGGTQRFNYLRNSQPFNFYTQQLIKRRKFKPIIPKPDKRTCKGNRGLAHNPHEEMRFYKFYPKECFDFETKLFTHVQCSYCQKLINYYTDNGQVERSWIGFWHCKQCKEDKYIGGWAVCYKCMGEKVLEQQKEPEWLKCKVKDKGKSNQERHGIVFRKADPGDGQCCECKQNCYSELIPGTVEDDLIVTCRHCEFRICSQCVGSYKHKYLQQCDFDQHLWRTQPSPFRFQQCFKLKFYRENCMVSGENLRLKAADNMINHNQMIDWQFLEETDICLKCLRTCTHENKHNLITMKIMKEMGEQARNICTVNMKAIKEEQPKLPHQQIMRYYRFYPKFPYRFASGAFDGCFCDYCHNLIQYYPNTGEVSEEYKGIWDCKECHLDEKIGGWNVCQDCMMGKGKDFELKLGAQCTKADDHALEIRKAQKGDGECDECQQNCYSEQFTGTVDDDLMLNCVQCQFAVCSQCVDKHLNRLYECEHDEHDWIVQQMPFRFQQCFGTGESESWCIISGEILNLTPIDQPKDHNDIKTLSFLEKTLVCIKCLRNCTEHNQEQYAKGEIKWVEYEEEEDDKEDGDDKSDHHSDNEVQEVEQEEQEEQVDLGN